MLVFGLYSYFLKLWDHRNKHICFEEVIRLKKESLDDKLAQAWSDFYKETRKSNATASGTEQFEEMVEKYQRPNFDDNER